MAGISGAPTVFRNIDLRLLHYCRDLIESLPGT